MGYYDENGLWIEDGTTYIFKPGSLPEDHEIHSPEDDEQGQEVEDEKEEKEGKVEQEVLMVDGKIVD